MKDLSDSKNLEFVQLSSGKIVMGGDFETVLYLNFSEVTTVWDEEDFTKGEEYEGVIPQKWIEEFLVRAYYRPEKAGTWVPFGLSGEFFYELREV